MSALVIDASVLVDVLADDALDGDTARAAALAHRWVAPMHLPIEVLAVLRRNVRMGLLAEDRAARALVGLRAVRITYVDQIAIIDRTWELRHNLTAYDAAYVAAAEHMGCPLLTRDAGIAGAPQLKCEVRLI